jgi:hypothetical protein
MPEGRPVAARDRILTIISHGRSFWNPYLKIAYKTTITTNSNAESIL